MEEVAAVAEGLAEGEVGADFDVLEDAEFGEVVRVVNVRERLGEVAGLGEGDVQQELEDLNRVMCPILSLLNRVLIYMLLFSSGLDDCFLE